MITDELLEEKYHAQRILAKEAEYDLRKYAENAHQNVREAETCYGIKFKYGRPRVASLTAR